MLGNNLATAYPPQVGEQIPHRPGGLVTQGLMPKKPALRLALAGR
jgi:hypothetical protein